MKRRAPTVRKSSKREVGAASDVPRAGAKSPGRNAGRVAVVTGAGGQLGRAVTQRLAQTGFWVVAADVRPPSARKKIAPAFLDTTDESSVRALRDAVVKQHGHVDLLVTCAGAFEPRSLLALSAPALRDILDVNLVGPFLVTRAFGELMAKAGWGRIIHVASVAGLKGFPGGAAYAAAKAGVLALTKSAALEWAPLGVRVMAVAPGYFDSDWTHRRADELSSRVPVKRLGTAEEVAEVIDFLANCQGDYLTGSTVLVDGGLGAT